MLMTTRETSGDLELGLLRTFLRVVNHGSLCKAAAAAKVTQPAVSQQILRLEKIVGDKIFVRGRDGVSLTPHGQVLLTHAHIALELSDETLRKLHGEDGRRPIALGVSTRLALAALGSALKRFEFLHPSLQLSVAVAIPDKAFAQRTTSRPSQPRAQEKARRRVQTGPRSVNTSHSFEELLHWQDELLDGQHKAGRDW
jgi:hypothetical protein